MADEKGSIEIGVRVNSQDAVKGLRNVQDALNGTGEAAGTMGREISTAAQETKSATTSAARTTIKENAKAQEALKGTGIAASKAARERRKAADTSSEISGLDSLKDSTGELDSSLKGLAGAVGVVNPEFEILLMRTGDLSGGIEAGTRLTSLFGGSMGQLLRVLGPVTIAVTGIFVAYNKLTGGLKEAEENLKEAHEEMEAGIAAARAYEARMRGVRVAVGLLTAEEQGLRDAQDAATQGLEHQSERMKAARERASVLRIAINKNAEAMSAAQNANASATISYIDLEDALDAAGRAARGEAAGMDRSTASAGSLRRNQEELRDTTRQLASALQQAEDEVNRYDSALERDTALHVISNAILSDNVDLMVEATDQLDSLAGSTRETVEARLLQAIATAQATKAEEESAEATDAARKASRDREEQLRKEEDARAKLIRMLAEATGEAAVINLDYADTIKEINEIVALTGATEAEAALLVQAATERKTQALAELKQAEEEYLETREKHLPAVVQLEEDAATAIEKVYQNRMADLLLAKIDESITEEQFHEQSLKAEERYQDQLAALRRAKQEQALQTASMISDSFMNLIDSNINMISQRIDQEEEEALAKAEGNLEEQEKIREKFDKKRKSELSAAYQKKKNLEIANAIISGASAAIAALAAPPIGLGPVGGAFLIPGIVASTAMQINTISQQNPSFHQGGIVSGMGDQPITAQGGEVVLNRSAVAALGGAQAADSLNNGGGASGTVVVQMTYKQRVFDQVVVDNLAKGGPLRSALNRAQRQGRRGRIGGRL